MKSRLVSMTIGLTWFYKPGFGAWSVEQELSLFASTLFIQRAYAQSSLKVNLEIPPDLLSSGDRVPDPAHEPMQIQHAINSVRDARMLKHLSFQTEKTYVHWVKRYGAFLQAAKLPPDQPSETKMEAFLISLARTGVFVSIGVHSWLQPHSLLLLSDDPGIWKPLRY